MTLLSALLALGVGLLAPGAASAAPIIGIEGAANASGLVELAQYYRYRRHRSCRSVKVCRWTPYGRRCHWERVCRY